MEVHVQGYGSITVERSELETDDQFSDFVGGVVAKVMTLVDPQTQKERFHPALGIGGYEARNSRGTARRELDSGTD